MGGEVTKPPPQQWDPKTVLTGPQPGEPGHREVPQGVPEANHRPHAVARRREALAARSLGWVLARCERGGSLERAETFSNLMLGFPVTRL